MKWKRRMLFRFCEGASFLDANSTLSESSFHFFPPFLLLTSLNLFLPSSGFECAPISFACSSGGQTSVASAVSLCK